MTVGVIECLEKFSMVSVMEILRFREVLSWNELREDQEIGESSERIDSV